MNYMRVSDCESVTPTCGQFEHSEGGTCQEEIVINVCYTQNGSKESDAEIARIRHMDKLLAQKERKEIFKRGRK